MSPPTRNVQSLENRRVRVLLSALAGAWPAYTADVFWLSGHILPQGFGGRR